MIIKKPKEMNMAKTFTIGERVICKTHVGEEEGTFVGMDGNLYLVQFDGYKNFEPFTESEIFKK